VLPVVGVPFEIRECHVIRTYRVDQVMPEFHGQGAGKAV